MIRWSCVPLVLENSRRTRPIALHRTISLPRHGTRAHDKIDLDGRVPVAVNDLPRADRPHYLRTLPQILRIAPGWSPPLLTTTLISSFVPIPEHVTLARRSNNGEDRRWLGDYLGVRYSIDDCVGRGSASTNLFVMLAGAWRPGLAGRRLRRGPRSGRRRRSRRPCSPRRRTCTCRTTHRFLPEGVAFRRWWRTGSVAATRSMLEAGSRGWRGARVRHHRGSFCFVEWCGGDDRARCGGAETRLAAADGIGRQFLDKEKRNRRGGLRSKRWSGATEG
jgi:hypothetical protein